MAQTESLTDWQMRIRNATTPSELLQVADEMRAKSEEARRLSLTEEVIVKPRATGRWRAAGSSRRGSDKR